MHNQQNEDETTERVLLEAMARRLQVNVRYNGATMQLSPHRMFSRFGELYLSAFNPNKNWRSEEEYRLGHFKLSGLGDVTLCDDGFEPLAGLDPALPRDSDELIFAV